MLKDRMELCELRNQDFEIRVGQMAKLASETNHSATQQTMPSTLRENPELKEMENRLVNLIN
jgi:hypothetical protein